MQKPFRRRRFYSEQIGPCSTPKKKNEFLIESPQISNLELVKEVEDFVLEEHGDLFDELLKNQTNLSKEEFFGEMMKEEVNSKGESIDSFELEIEKSKQKLIFGGKREIIKDVHSSSTAYNNFIYQNSIDNISMLKRDLKGNNGNKTLASDGVRISQENTREIKKILKNKKNDILKNFFNFNLSVNKQYPRNRNRSQSYSVGQNSSIYDFITKK